MDINDLRIPEHLGIILDGNRRFAKKLAKKPWEGHKLGAKTLRKFLDYAKEFQIKEITFYALSIQNLNRNEVELNFLLNLIKEHSSYYLGNEGFKEISKDQVRIKIIGNLSLLPDDLQEIFLKLEEKTKDFNKFKLNFAIAYGSQEEIVEATKKIIKDIELKKISINELNTSKFSEYLWLNSEPDLIIRTSGVFRTSNFLLWQSAYSEWVFIDKLWPEFSKEDLIYCLEEFSKRERRFGK
jgi:undecaprenyl diphosphate synthase